MSLVPFPKQPDQPKKGSDDVNYYDPKMLSELDEMLEQAKSDRLPLERQWYENIAFYMGKQWLTWDPSRKTLMPPEVPDWRVLVTVNLVRDSVRTEYSKITQQAPQIIIQPNSDDPDDVRKAKAGQKITDYIQEVTYSVKTSKRALMWGLICGTAIWKVYWDKTAGIFIEKDLWMGEVSVDEVSPFEFHPDPFGIDIAAKNWCFQSKLRSVKYVRDKYGKDVTAQEFASEEFLEGRISAIVDNTDSSHKEGVLVREFHERSSVEFPQGRRIVYGNDQLLKAGSNPSLRMQVPYVAFPHIEVPGRFWGESHITDMLDPQRNYNKSRSQSIEIRNLMSKPQWMIPRGSIDKPISSAPGQQIVYTPIRAGSARYPAKPEPVSGKDVPATFWKDLDQSRQEIQEVAGQHEVSHAQVPGQVKSGTAIQYLQEQDDLRLGPSSQSYEEAYEQVVKCQIMLARQYYQEQRTARVVGEGNRVEVIEFYREDLPLDTQVKVQAGSSLPKSRVAKQQFLLELWDRKLIQDPRQILEMLEFGDVEGLYDDINRDIARAQRENDKMRDTGQTATVEDFDNHAIHMHEHNAFRKGEEYEGLDATYRQAFAQHCATHQQQLDAAQKSQLEMQMALESKRVVMGKMTPGQEESIFPSTQQAQQAPAAPPTPGAPGPQGAETAKEASTGGGATPPTSMGGNLT